MKRLCLAATLVAITASAPALAADVGVSISVGEPGFYGQIDIGNVPRPVLVYPQPVVIQPAPFVAAPIYLHVPPGHAKHWDRHCAEYGACSRPVYFVQDRWYNTVYVPQYRRKHGEWFERRDRDEYRGDWNEHRGRGRGRRGD